MSGTYLFTNIMPVSTGLSSRGLKKSVTAAAAADKASLTEKKVAAVVVMANAPGSELIQRDRIRAWSAGLTKKARIERFSLTQSQAVSQYETLIQGGGPRFFMLRNVRNPLVGDLLGLDIHEDKLTKSAVGTNVVALGPVIFSAILLPGMAKVTYYNYVTRWMEFMDNLSVETNTINSARVRAGSLVETVNKAVKSANADIYKNIKAIEFICNEQSVTIAQSDASSLTKLQEERLLLVIAYTDKYLECVASSALRFFQDLEAIELVREQVHSVQDDRLRFVMQKEDTSSDDEEDDANALPAATATTTPPSGAPPAAAVIAQEEEDTDSDEAEEVPAPTMPAAAGVTIMHTPRPPSAARRPTTTTGGFASDAKSLEGGTASPISPLLQDSAVDA